MADFSYFCNALLKKLIQEEKFSAPMPWIGLYVAVASLICSSLMATDAFLGFHNKKLWFPCRFFTLNATTLTLLAVAMKIPVDLSTPMRGPTDQLSKLSSIVFMCTVMGNFMPSLGQMTNEDIFMNLTALCILVITIFGNICIQLATGVLYSLLPLLLIEQLVVLFLMPVLLVIVCFSALSIPSARKYIDMKYNEINKDDTSQEPYETKRLEFDQLKDCVRNYWMMAETGSPQFVIGRSVTCCVSGAICILSALILVEAEFRIYYSAEILPFDGQRSSYKWSTFVILVIQTIGVGLGTIAPAIRWFSAIKMKCSGKRGESFTSAFKTEKYWIAKLVEWRESPLPFKIRSPKFKKLVHTTRNLLLCFCIRVQTVIVVASKSIQLLFVLFIGPVLFCYSICKWVMRKFISICTISRSHTGSESEHVRNVDLSCYVLHLEGEKELPERMLKNIRDVADRLIQKGRKKQPKHLIELVQKSAGFKGLAEFDSEQVPSLSSCEPRNSWMLPLVTLTSIAISLPNIASHMVEGLLKSVSEGLVYVSLLEKDLDAKGDLIYIRNAAEVIWLGIELYGKWLDTDLRKMALNGKNFKTTLQRLSDISKDCITEFKRNANGSVKENPQNWPVQVIAANSMYRISQTVLLNYECSSNIESTNDTCLDRKSVV